MVEDLMCLGCGRRGIQPRQQLDCHRCRECGSTMLVEDEVFERILGQVIASNPINWRGRRTEIGKRIFARIEAVMARLKEEGVTLRPIRSRYIVERILEQL